MARIISLFLLALLPFISSGCSLADGDTTKKKPVTVNLSEVVVERGGKVKEIGLSNLKIKSSCQGLTGDRMAVYIPHPSSKEDFFIQAFEVAIQKPEAFEQGYVKLYLCEAVDANHAPGKNILDQDLRISPADKSRLKHDRIQVDLLSEVELPKSGVFAVFEWVYDRTPADQMTRRLRSAKVAGTFDIDQSYTWTSVGDLKGSWQHEGGYNSLSKNIFNGKLYNALIGLVVRGK